MKYTHIIWDFNGTIFDDVEIGIESVNALLAARNMPLISSKEYYRSVHSFPVIDYYKKIGFDFSKESFDDIAVEWVREYMSRLSKAGVHQEALEMLSYIRKNGAKQILLSATEEKMLLGQVKDLGIEPYFDEICGMDNIYAHGKKSLAERWRQNHPDARALLVGDTDHDFEVAQVMGADCILFAGGHQSRNVFAGLGCPVVDGLLEVKNFL